MTPSEIRNMAGALHLRVTRHSDGWLLRGVSGEGIVRRTREGWRVTRCAGLGRMQDAEHAVLYTAWCEAGRLARADALARERELRRNR